MPIPPPIPKAVRQLLAELELLSHGSTTAWNPTGGTGDDVVVPFGESDPPHLRLRARYLAQTADAGRARVVEEMRVTLRGHRGVSVDRSVVVGESREAEDARILQTGEDFSAEEVARRFNCTPTRVRRLRLADGRDVERGRRSAPAAPVADAAGQALRMKANGMSERQIALVLGQHRTTVTRWLKKAEI
jgi:DNA invertase Pin-like site-specific DNA recombinase